MCGVEPAKLLTVAQTMADGTLKSKTQEIGAVLTEYEALVSKSFLDPLDDLTRLKNQLAAHPFFAGAFVAVACCGCIRIRMLLRCGAPLPA